MKIKDYEIHVSNTCNRKCEFCVSQMEPRAGKMSIAVADGIARKIPDGANVTFSGGGEPTTNIEVLEYLIGLLQVKGCRVGLTTNGFKTANFDVPLDWIRLSVYDDTTIGDVVNVLRTNARIHGAAFFFTDMVKAERYRDSLSEFDYVVAKSLNGHHPIDDEVRARLIEMGFRVKVSATENDFAECKFFKPTFDINGELYRCCLRKAQGINDEPDAKIDPKSCIVPCITYNSNKQGRECRTTEGFIV